MTGVDCLTTRNGRNYVRSGDSHGRLRCLLPGEQPDSAKAILVARLDSMLRTGPRSTRVATFTSDDELPQGRGGSFEIVS